MVVEKAAANGDSIFPRDAGAKEDGEQFVVSQGTWPEPQHLFAGLFSLGQVVNEFAGFHTERGREAKGRSAPKGGRLYPN